MRLLSPPPTDVIYLEGSNSAVTSPLPVDATYRRAPYRKRRDCWGIRASTLSSAVEETSACRRQSPFVASPPTQHETRRAPEKRSRWRGSREGRRRKTGVLYLERSSKSLRTSSGTHLQGRWSCIKAVQGVDDAEGRKLGIVQHER